MAAPSVQLLNTLKDLLWKVYEVEETVRCGGGPEQQEVLEQRLLAMTKQMREASHMTHPFEDFKVPIDLLKYLDDGGFPDTFTAESFRSCLTDNQASKGKVDAVDQLRGELLQQLQQQLPQETAEYLQLLQQHGVAPPPGGTG